jgi:hypothetical protein
MASLSQIDGSEAARPWSWREAAAYFALASLIDIAVGIPAAPQVLLGSLLNPDSYMRLVRLHDSLPQHRLLDVVGRDGSGLGTVLHWSHLLDGILLLLAAPLMLAMDARHALYWAGVALGPLGMGCLGAALAWVLAPYTDRRRRWLAVLLACVSAYIMGYGWPGVVHHHILIAVAATMAAGWALRAASHGLLAGWHMAVWAAFGIWLTPESMPFLLMAWGGVGLAWLFHPARPAIGESLRAFGSGFLVLIAAALSVDPPLAGRAAAEIDRLSLVYLVLALVLCGIGWAVWQIDERRWPALRRAASGGVVALAGIALWFALFPQVLRGTDGLMSTADAQAFLGVIAEMMPIDTWHGAVANLSIGALATAMLAIMAVRHRSPLWAYGALCGGVMLILGLLHARFATYSEVLGAAVLPLALTECGRAFPRAWEAWHGALRVMVLILFFYAPRAGDLVSFDSQASASESPATPSCALRHIDGLLAPYAGAVVIASVNDTPELLYRSEIDTVGSLYHRNVAAYLRLRAAWRSAPSDEPPAEVDATGASLLLFCRSLARPLFLEDLPPVTLWDRLNRGEVPSWLTPLGVDKESGNTLYRIAGKN